MPLKSRLLSGDKRLQDCLVSDPAHVTPGSKGSFVGKIHTALLIADGASVSSKELLTETYGPSTAAAVLAFKRKRKIINFTYQSSEDDIVGKMTIAALDADVARHELLARIPPPPHKPGFT